MSAISAFSSPSYSDSRSIGSFFFTSLPLRNKSRNPNIRPTLDQENLKPSRVKIHDLFMEHVMAQAPGYNKLMNWTHHPIMPTPGAVGEIIKRIAES